MPELRWILIAFGFALLIGIYVWGRRSAKPTTEDAVQPSVRPDPVFDSATSYEEFERPLVAPIEDVEVEARFEEPADIEPRELRTGGLHVYRPVDETQEPTIEAKVERAPRDARSMRIEPTFSEESVTAELPVEHAPHDPDPIVTPARTSVPQPSNDAPTLSMSSTPAPRRIERRKIIALRLAAGSQRLNGAQLKAAFESEGLQHGKYDVFHRVHGDDGAIFSVASMVEPGTFDPEKMPQESFPGITLFTQLPAPVAGMLAFNELVACSRRLHAALGGTLQDERGVPLTVHRIERIRQEIREFEHRPAGDAQRPTFSPTP